MKGQKFGGRRAGTPNKRTQALRARILRDEELSVEATIEAIRRGQGYDARQLFDDCGNLRPLHELTEEEAWCIAGFEVVIKNAAAGDGHTDTVHKVKLIDRGRYVELAAKHQGMLIEKREVNVTVNVVDALQAARKRFAQQRALTTLTA